MNIPRKPPTDAGWPCECTEVERLRQLVEDLEEEIELVTQQRDDAYQLLEEIRVEVQDTAYTKNPNTQYAGALLTFFEEKE